MFLPENVKQCFIITEAETAVATMISVMGIPWFMVLCLLEEN